MNRGLYSHKKRTKWESKPRQVLSRKGDGNCGNGNLSGLLGLLQCKYEEVLETPSWW